MRSLLLPLSGAVVALAIQGPFLKPKTVSTPAFTPEMAEVLSHMRIVTVDEPGVGLVKVLRIGGVNVQIMNENTDSDFSSTGPYTKNGLGNLIIGWNPTTLGGGSPISIDRSGSHNLVLGVGNGYSATGGIVTGLFNRILSDDSAVIGGDSSWAAFGGTVIGASDSAAANNGVVVGGNYNGAGVGGPDWPFSGGTTGSFRDVTIGGESNCAIGSYSAVGGGYGLQATGGHEWVDGSLYEDD